MMYWTPRRKAEILAKLATGAVTQEVLLREHELSVEEIAEWRRMYETYGMLGLRSGRGQRSKIRNKLLAGGSAGP